jgi:hypothetical protein
VARDIVSNLKFKKSTGKFNPADFGDMLNEAYIATKRGNQVTTKTSFSPSTIGYGHGNCPRYWYLAFSGVMFIDDNDAVAIANMKQGTQAHERLQGLIKTFPTFVSEEEEIKNEYPPIRGFIDLILNVDGEKVIGEIKTAKQEVWDTRQAEMKTSANHMLQLLTYMKLTNAKEGFFLYENKNTQEVLIIPVQMNERNTKIINDTFDWLCEVWDNFKDGDLPYRHFTKSTSTCKYCPVKDACYELPRDGIQIPAFVVPKI